MPQPTKIPVAFADTGDKNVIPQSTVTPGLASWSIGFPAITSTPFAQGGVAPKRADFNGIFNALSAAIVWQQQGGIFTYDNLTDYEPGNIVLYNGALYFCLVANGPGSVVVTPTNTTSWTAIVLSSGAIMRGTITSAVHPALNRNSDNSYLTLAGGTAANVANGSFMYLYGVNSSQPGAFRIYTGVNSHNLFGKSDGSLTWDNNDILTAETGTFTPTIDGQTTTGAFTYSVQSGTYVKFGVLCYIELRVVGEVATLPSGNITIGGTPYLPSSANQAINLDYAPSSSNIFDKCPTFFRVGTSGGLLLWGTDIPNNTAQPCKFASGLTVGDTVELRASGVYRTS